MLEETHSRFYLFSHTKYIDHVNVKKYLGDFALKQNGQKAN